MEPLTLEKSKTQTQLFENIVAYIRQLYNTPQGMIPLHEPRFRGNEKKYVADAIDSTFVSSVGKYVDRFEQMMCEYTGARYAVATGNGTAALHIAMLVAGVEKNDLVITQALSFIATCNAIKYLGADPLFLDIDLKTLGLSAEKLAAFLKEETRMEAGVCYHKKSNRCIKACVPMHTFGHPVVIDAIVETCKQYNIALVEDAAESIGSKYKNQHTGTFGLLGTFSFNGNKTITCGGGGAIVTNDEKLAKFSKHLTTQAKVPHPWEYVHDYVGYNYRLPNLNAALACAQMEELDTFLHSKREIANSYRRFFETTGVPFIVEPAHAHSNYWLNAILFADRDEREAFLKYSNDNKVVTRPCWKTLNTLKIFEPVFAHDVENAGYIEDRLVNIPSSVI